MSFKEVNEIIFQRYILLMFFSAPIREFVSVLLNLSRCAVCQSNWLIPFPLPCGHVACQNCLQVLTNIALDAAHGMNLLQQLHQNSVT